MRHYLRWAAVPLILAAFSLSASAQCKVNPENPKSAAQCRQTAAAGKNCSVDRDCSRGEVCKFGRCQAGCNWDSDCFYGEICKFGRCQGCTWDSDCRGGKRCELGRCRH